MKKTIALHIPSMPRVLPVRVGCLAVVLWLPLNGLGAQQVDTEELMKGQAGPVNFINYSGPYARVDTRGQIWDIGYVPGTRIRAGARNAGVLARYFVIHSMSGPEGDKRDADIFGLGAGVGVDHIRNLRLIIQGYLEGAYAYSAQDAALLAQYITVYNAVFRGNWDYFTSRYKAPVLRNLQPDTAGLSPRYDDWPGRTLMLIPLAQGRADSLSAVDTGALSAAEVIEEMKKEPDLALGSRTAMLDLKQREADAAEQEAAREREALAEAEGRLAREREEAARERERRAREREAVEREKAAIAREREDARADGEAGGAAAEESRRREEVLARRAAEAEGKEAELEKQEAEAGEQEAEREKQEAALAEKREEAEAAEAFAERKAGEARQDRQGIIQDQKALSARPQSPPEPPPVEPGGILGIRLINADSPLGRFVRVNPGNGRELHVSEVNTVHVRTVISLGGKIFSVAGENRGNGAVRIVEIDAGTLEIINQGEDDIHPQSLLWVYNGAIYAAANQGGAPRLARFNTGLEREALSAITIHPYATPVFQEGVVLIQRADGSPEVLNGDDLSERRQNIR
ncbi:MAG: hypothetical protein LBE17_07375 [Treponema sp.]|jgi:hypothetical protein|nr:hypothetical protein [Treponema sp.]